jgi:hypothetical protein
LGESGAAEITRRDGGKSARLKSSVWMVMGSMLSASVQVSN